MTSIGSFLIPRSDSLAVNFSHAKKINLLLNKQTAKTKAFHSVPLHEKLKQSYHAKAA